MERARVFLKIYGQVQGVSFRYYAQNIARKLKLRGWAKNEIDGTVIIEAEGKVEKLKELIKWCHNGPALAAVEKVDVQWKEFKGDLGKFEVQF
ncbi:MAG: acylphosphatase [Candidatus Kerfeldbacteria bacterium CG08_land_8_20_14_0_20_40_16]|uniref:Acylphosphatase n=1 Tax=Candidatus Kerfeldbacteria bacterium CG08_land_8_20_14_0_20_40_16 TaxID=2014244 RepID=A0A2H0YVY4_9BACT|nr:MAG: acylphosphatase [Candidatus Kerfeldbacteria bacterium CG08_land_8_20_14_0_20_40_16]